MPATGRVSPAHESAYGSSASYGKWHRRLSSSLSPRAGFGSLLAGNSKRRGQSCPRRLRSTSIEVALVDPGRPVAEERGEQAKQENEHDKTNSHTGPSLPSRWTVRAPGVLTKYAYAT